MTIYEQEIFVNDVVAINGNVTRKFRQDPNTFTFTKNSGCLVYRFIFSNQSVEEGKSIDVLNWFVTGVDKTENFTGIRSHCYISILFQSRYQFYRFLHD